MKVAAGIIGAIGLALMVYLALRVWARPAAPTPVSDPQLEVVTLRLVASPERSGKRWFDFEYDGEGGTTRFALELDEFSHRPTEDNPFSVTQGTLHRKEGSTAAPLLAALRRVHGVVETIEPLPRLE